MKFNHENNLENTSKIPKLETEASLEIQNDGTSPLWKLQYQAQYGIQGENVRFIELSEDGNETPNIIEGGLDKEVELGKQISFNNGEIKTWPLRAVNTDNEGAFFVRTENKIYKIEFLGAMN